MTRYEAFVESGWREHGLAYVLVARIKETRIDIGGFLVDRWCLGIKNALFTDDATESEFAEMLDEHLPAATRERIHPACAKKLIEGAIAYAETLGIAPHRDFRKARRVLSGLNAADCPETFTYGCDGRPRYLQGPHDSEERVDKVLALLEARVGPDGYDFDEYEEFADDGAGADMAGDFLRDFIVEHPAPAFGTYAEFCGLIASLHVCPKTVPLSKLLALFTHPDFPSWASAEEAQGVAGSVAVYWNDTNERLAEVAADPLNGYVIDIHEADEGKPIPPQFALWCRGFMRSLELWPEAWLDALDRPQLKKPFAVLHAWAGADDRRAEKLYQEDVDAEDTITNAVIALYRVLEPERNAGTESQI